MILVASPTTSPEVKNPPYQPRDGELRLLQLTRFTGSSVKRKGATIQDPAKFWLLGSPKFSGVDTSCSVVGEVGFEPTTRLRARILSPLCKPFHHSPWRRERDSHTCKSFCRASPNSSAIAPRQSLRANLVLTVSQKLR